MPCAVIGTRHGQVRGLFAQGRCTGSRSGRLGRIEHDDRLRLAVAWIAKPEKQRIYVHGWIGAAVRMMPATCEPPQPLCVVIPNMEPGRSFPTPARGIPRLSNPHSRRILSALATCNAARSSTCTGAAGIAALPGPHRSLASAWRAARFEPSLNPPLALFATPAAAGEFTAPPSHYRMPAGFVAGHVSDAGIEPMQVGTFRAVNPSGLNGQHGADGAGLQSQRARLPFMASKNSRAFDFY